VNTSLPVFLFMPPEQKRYSSRFLQLPDETVHKLTTDFSLEYLRSYSCGDVSLSCKRCLDLCHYL